MPPKKSTGTRRGTTAAPLKNYLSEASLSNIMEAIRKTLAEGGARRVSFDYSALGHIKAITFTLSIGDQLATFCLPARQESVGPLLKESYRTAGRSCPTGDSFDEQVERVAWANIRDWLAGQVALIRTQMVKPHEVFLPYLLLEGYEQPLTYFEAFEQHHALPEPEQRGHVSIVEQLA
jgi:hypothetical protein